MTTAKSNPFLEFWNAGYKALVPIVPPGATPSPKSTLYRRPKAIGKAPGIKGDDGLWRGFDWLKHDTTPDDLVRWHFMGAGVGIKTGSGLVAVDVDTLNPELVEKIVDAAGRHLGSAPVRVGRAPKLLLLYAVPVAEAVPYRRVLFDDGLPCDPGAEPRVELLTEGRQFVAHGIHPATGTPYTWPRGCKPADKLTRVTLKQLDAFFADLATFLPAAAAFQDTLPAERAAVDQQALKGRIEDVRRAVAALPNTTALYPSYDDYVRVGYAIKAATQDDPEEGLALFQAWAAKWDGGNEPEVVEADWRRMKPPFSIGAQFLYQEAERHAPKDQPFDRALTLLEALPDTGADLGIPTSTAAAGKTYEFLSLHARSALALNAASRPLIKGLLDCTAMTVLYGESNSGKTFVALAMSFCIAAGLPWAGLKVTPGPVAYVVAEGGRGISKRTAALVAANPEHAAAPLLTLTSNIDLLRPDADLVPLTKAILALNPRPVLIVIDTLSRVLAGGDENSSTDMGALVKHLDLIRAATQAHILVVHHTGKDRARGARGHSLLRAATDTEIEIADNTITVTKQRDIEKSWSSGFTLDSAVLGFDAEGDPVTSATVKLTGEAVVEVEKGVATQTEAAILEAVRMLARTNIGGSGVVKTDLLLAFVKDNVSAKMTKSSLANLLKSAEAKRLVRRPARGHVEINDDTAEPNVLD